MHTVQISQFAPETLFVGGGGSLELSASLVLQRVFVKFELGASSETLLIRNSL
jgi:hypothetical protein